jgi:hypothetical protein
MLLGASMIHNEVELEREVREDLVRFYPAGYGRYRLPVNVFASCGVWDETENVWKIMRGIKVKKTTGFSFGQIEVNMKINAFYSQPGSRSSTMCKRYIR